MDRIKAKHILKTLERINIEIDLLGKILVNKGMKPVPVHVKIQRDRKFR
jgi:hypothetical protein